MIRSRSLLASVVLALPAAVGAQAPVPGAPTGVTAFTKVNVVPMDTERVLSNQTLLIENGWITAVGPANKVEVPKGAVRIDGRGKYLIPGLADMHAHLEYKNDTAGIERRLFLYLANGVTTVRNMDYSNKAAGHRALLLRGRAAAGELWSPRIYTAGPWGPRHYVFPTDRLEPRVDSIAFYVAAYQEAGYDFLKVHEESGVVMDSVIAAAHWLGLPLAGHAPDDSGVMRALAAGYGSIEHLTGYVEHLLGGSQSVKFVGTADSAVLAAQRRRLEAAAHKIPELAAATQRAGVWNCPTLAVLEAQLWEANREMLNQWPEMAYVSAEIRNDWNRRSIAPSFNASGLVIQAVAAGTRDARRRLVTALQDAGAGLLLGTDAPAMFMVPGFSVHRELQALVRAGLTPYQALATGTRNVATFLETLDEAGSIAVGKRADLVLIRGNPLQDIRHTANPAGIMIGGRWLPREEIDRRLTSIRTLEGN